MSTNTWKDIERRIARKLGGERVGNRGTSTPDVLTDWLAVEVKHRQELPRWIVQAVQKARGHAGRERLGIAVLHEHGKHDNLVVLSLSDFQEWFESG